ncbi:MAG TPA: DUF3152 domain-containing protein [Propionibacterium sp.]|nr:DUF3152 domain-containing protein [Propionibacterium sp.]
MLLISVMVIGFYRGNLAGTVQAAPVGSVPEVIPADDTEGEGPGRAPSQPSKSVPRAGSGEVRVAQFTKEALPTQSGRTVRVRVEVEKDMPTLPEQAAADVAAILQDDRSWSSKQPVRFAFVGEGRHDLVIRVLTPSTTDEHCLPLDTGGELSCSIGREVNLNGIRWETGIPDYAGDLPGYRAYLVNHEVGHYLGYGHESCPGPGKPAPVMMQQTKGLKGCARNPWP